MLTQWDELRAQVATGCRILANEGVSIGAFGHISTRVPGSEALLIKSRGPHEEGLEFATAGDIVAMDSRGEPLEVHHRIGPPNEKHIHLGVYARRPEVNCVIHVHPALVVALTAAGRAILPLYGAYEPAGLALVAPGVPIFPSSVLIDSTDLGRAVADVMGESDVCILSGHGIVVCGGDIEEAVARTLAFAELARVNWMAAAVGANLKCVDADDMAAWQEKYKKVGASTRIRDDGHRSDWYGAERRLTGRRGAVEMPGGSF